jgi:hypothetical protein
MIIFCAVLGCTTEMGFEPATDAGRGNIVIWEKNGLNARIFLDYRPTELVTPATMENVPAGNHTIHLFHENYVSIPAAKVIDVLAKSNNEAQFDLQKTSSGACEVATEPAGAIVTLDDVDFGVSPLSLKGLSSGTYRVGARRGNYRAADVTVAVSPTAGPKLHLALDLTRSVVIEYFSNTNCAGCPAAGAAVRHLLEQLPQYNDQVFMVSYHVGFPNANDPFYIAAKDDQNARMTLYNMQSAPAIYINGVAIGWLNEAAFISEAKKRIEAVIQAHDSVTAELSFGGISSDSLQASGTVLVKGGNAGQQLFVALVEDFVGYDTPLGTNNQRLFHAIFRGFAKDANGASVSGTEMEIPFSVNFRSSNPLIEYSLVAFLQNAGTGEIIQSQRVFIHR